MYVYVYVYMYGYGNTTVSRLVPDTIDYSAYCKHCPRMNAEADIRMPLSSIKPQVKEILKNLKQHYFHCIFIWKL